MNIPEGLSQEQVDEAIRITDASEKAYGPVFATLISLLLPSLSLGTPAYCLPEDEYEEIFGPALGAEGIPDGPVYYAVDGEGFEARYGWGSLDRSVPSERRVPPDRTR